MTSPNHLLAHGRIALVERFAQHAPEGLAFGGEAKARRAIRQVPEPQEDASIFVDHVEGGGDEEATYEEAWQIVNEKTIEGWKLRGMEKVLAGDGVELLWDASDGRRRQR